MCGRFAQLPVRATEPVWPWADLGDALATLPARYNMAPTQNAGAVVVDRQGQAGLLSLRWSLVPHWAKGPLRYNLINARLESVATKPAYRDAWRGMRCLVPMAGYFEWLAGGGRKVPHYLTRGEHATLFAAGVWSLSHGGKEGQAKGSFALITRAAEGVAATVHERMPAFVPAAQAAAYVGGDAEQAMQALQELDPPELQSWPVSTMVNSPKNDAPELIEPSG